MHINSYDTNGINNKAVRYYFQAAGQPFDTTQAENSSIFRKNNVDTVMWTMADIGTPNQSKRFWIAALDDDGLLRGTMGGTPYIVFADSAPRAITATSDGVTGGRKISWSGLDVKDSLATQFRILIKKGSQPDTSANSPDVVKDWTAGSDVSLGYNSTYVGYFSLTYTPQSSGTYYYQIISRDARGTKTATPLSGTNNFIF